MAMGEAKRRKELLGDKYGTPEYSNKKFTRGKLIDDIAKNPQSQEWTLIIWMFIAENWNHDFLAELSDTPAYTREEVEIILAEIDKWWERFTSEDYEKSLSKDPLISIGDLVKNIACAFEFIAILFNTEGCPAIDFKACNVNSEKEVKSVLLAFSLAIYQFHHPRKQDMAA